MEADAAATKAFDLSEKLATFSEPWQPRVVGPFNGHDLMVARLKGESLSECRFKRSPLEGTFGPAAVTV